MDSIFLDLLLPIWYVNLFPLIIVNIHCHCYALFSLLWSTPNTSKYLSFNAFCMFYHLNLLMVVLESFTWPWFNYYNVHCFLDLKMIGLWQVTFQPIYTSEHWVLPWSIETMVLSWNKRSQRALNWLVSVEVNNDNCTPWKWRRGYS
jgi:hypothetical protein